MPNDLFSRDLNAPESIVVSTKQKIVSFIIKDGNFKTNYIETKVLPDGTELTSSEFSVDRSLDDIDISDLITQLSTNSEQFRQENEDAVAKDAAAAAAEAIRWAALSPQQQQAESDAAIAARLADLSVSIDPNPLGAAIAP